MTTQEKRREYRARWRARNPDKSRACTAAWALANPDRVKEKNRRLHLKKKKSQNERSRKWQRENAERAAATKKAWILVNPDKICLYERRRKARKLAIGGDHSSDDVTEIRRLQSGKCAYCRIDLKKTKSHVDHILPLALGGDNSRSNLQILCQDCNLTKGASHPIDFAQRIGRLI